MECRALDPSVQAALKILDELEPVPTGPVRLSSSYLRAVKSVEVLPDNQSGADKTCGWERLFGSIWLSWSG